MPKLLLFCAPKPVRKRTRGGLGAIGWVHAALKGEPETTENAEPAHPVLGQRLRAKTPHRVEAQKLQDVIHAGAAFEVHLPVEVLKGIAGHEIEGNIGIG